MKIAINRCYGGFNLSPSAIKKIAEYKGRECHFFQQEGFKGPYIPVNSDDVKGVKSMFLAAFDIQNPNDIVPPLSPEEYYAKTNDERSAHNALNKKHRVHYDADHRTDADVIRVVEELGEAASGECGKLKIVEIPDGTNYEIEEYDGMESVEEAHQSWT